MFVLALTLLAGLTLACKAEPSVPTSDVAGAPPWSGSETLSYAVKNEAGGDLGRIELVIATSGDKTTLSQRFKGSNTTDDIDVVVDARTLKPQSSERHVVTRNDDETIETTYTPQGAAIKQGDKQSGMSVPEHAYDNDTSLFLWRTLPFQPGYEGRYVTIITNRRSRQDVSLRVLSRETVRVPAGEFAAWRLEVRAGGVTQHAWYADIPSRPLVRYDNDNGLIYELETRPSMPPAPCAGGATSC